MYSQEQIDKIGNAVIYLSENTLYATKTKLLKLIYLLDEFSIKKTGLPFFNINYKVWKFGPVAQDLYVELSSKPMLFKAYFSLKNEGEKSSIVPKKQFSDDEFTDNDLEILKLVAERFKSHTSKDLVNFTHHPNSLWHTTAKRHNMLDDLLNHRVASTDIELNMRELIDYNEQKTAAYDNYTEMH